MNPSEDDAPPNTSPSLPRILRRTYRVESWRTWDRDLHTFAVDFHARLGAWPNILVASHATHAHLDMAAARAHVHDREGNPAPQVEHVSLGAFRGPGYELAFCVDNALPDRAVVLFMDPDPDGGEPVPEEDTPVEPAVGGARAAG